MDNSIQLNASIRLYEDDPMDEVIIQWLDSLPRRQEQGESRTRVYRRGIMREVRQALFEYAKKQNARRGSSPVKKVAAGAAVDPPKRTLSGQPSLAEPPPPPGQAASQPSTAVESSPPVEGAASAFGGPAFGPRVNF